MKEKFIKLLFYIWFLTLGSVVFFIPIYSIGTFMGIIFMMLNKDLTVATIIKVCFSISATLTLYGMVTNNHVVEKTYNNIRNRKI